MVSRNGVLCPRPRRKPVAAARSDPLASPSLSLRGHTPLQPRRLLSSLVFVVLCARGSFSTSAPATADARSAPLRGLFPRCIVPLHAGGRGEAEVEPLRGSLLRRMNVAWRLQSLHGDTVTAVISAPPVVLSNTLPYYAALLLGLFTLLIPLSPIRAANRAVLCPYWVLLPLLSSSADGPLLGPSQIPTTASPTRSRAPRRTRRARVSRLVLSSAHTCP